MTGQERILAAFNGGGTDLVPFAPNICVSFYYHRYHGTLPTELAHTQHPFDVLRRLDADILARWDTRWAVKEVYNAGEYHSEFVDQGGVPPRLPWVCRRLLRSTSLRPARTSISGASSHRTAR